MHTQKSSPLIDKMAPGHLINRGHELVAHLESEDGVTWSIVRECCTGNVADRHVENMTLDDVQKSLAEMPDGATGSPMHRALTERLRVLAPEREHDDAAVIDLVIEAAQSVKFWETHGRHGDGNLKAAQGKLAVVRSGAIARLQNRL